MCFFLLGFFCRDASNSSAGADIAHGGDKNQAGGIETGTASALGGGPAAGWEVASPFHHPGLGSSE
jgi:hypothetical protein